MVAVGVAQSLVDADADLNNLLSDAVELGRDSNGGLDGVVELGDVVVATGNNTVVGEHGGEVDLSLELESNGEVVVLAVDVLRGSAGTVLVVFVLPEIGGVVGRLEIRPDLTEGGGQISDLRSIELSSTVAGVSAIVVVGPQTVNSPEVESSGLGTAVDTSSAEGTRPTRYNRSIAIG